MILIQNVFLPLDFDFSNISTFLASFLKVNESEIKEAELYRKSVDARNKNQISFCCSYTVSLNPKTEAKLIQKNKNISDYRAQKYNWQRKAISKNRPVIVGFGPAGMFAALLLARSGLNPIVIERGDNVDKRAEKVKDFFDGGKLDTQSNIQFGEGGAGTFSDGKLNTGIKNFRCRTVIETFYEFGANENILYDAKPHIGTDILRKVVKNIREEIIKLGGEVRFKSCMTAIDYNDSGIESITLENGRKIFTDRVILCTGHSARDVFSLLKKNNVAMERKPFAMGVRIEHLQKDINKALYGDFYEHPALPTASYKLAVHLDSGRGVYTFCMCPGGEVVNASSEEMGIAVNGMSYNARNGDNANSALLVGVLPDDIDGDDILAGCRLQREIEEKAYMITNGYAPITTVGHFVFNEEAKIGKVVPSIKTKYQFAEIEDIFPDFISNSIKDSIIKLDKKLSGFADKDAIITAPETRSSSPVRILRDDLYQSLSIKGLYPCGEGAGYAGGIVSAAVDGLVCAEKLIESLA